MQLLCNRAQHVYNICGKWYQQGWPWAQTHKWQVMHRQGGHASEVWLEVSLTVFEPYAFSLVLSSRSLPVCPWCAAQSGWLQLVRRKTDGGEEEGGGRMAEPTQACKYTYSTQWNPSEMWTPSLLPSPSLFCNPYSLEWCMVFCPPLLWV